MAKPRIFVSSTYYDLRHVRASLGTFIQSLGYEPILSEKGDIAYSPDIPLDESCYREAGSADMLVLIIGGRYGTERSESRTDLPHSVANYILTKHDLKVQGSGQGDRSWPCPFCPPFGFMTKRLPTPS